MIFEEAMCHIVMVASANTPGVRIPSAIKCWHRPKNKPCTGHIIIQQEIDKDILNWECSECIKGGIISGWKYSRNNLIQFYENKGLDEYSFLLDEIEYQTLLKAEIVDIGLLMCVYQAIYSPRGILLSASYDDINYFPTEISAIKNHITDKKKILLLSSIINKIKISLEFETNATYH